MDPAQIAARHRAAETLAREGGLLAARYRAAPDALGVRRKGPQDIVTAADVAVEKLIVAALRAQFDGDAFVAEEGGGSAAEGAACWVIDPIDGTANFARGLPHWCVAIALVVAGRTEIGVIYEPAADMLYSARRGAGARRNGTPIRVSTTTDVDCAMIEIGYSSRTPADAFGALTSDLLRRGATLANCGSAALGLARVADGCSDGYAERHLFAWDVLAGLLLVEEAGGRASAFLEGDGLTAGNETIAATPALFATLCEVMAAHGR
jgi:myo-inositol-1(or 4)-monophosphatase